MPLPPTPAPSLPRSPSPACCPRLVLRLRDLRRSQSPKLRPTPSAAHSFLPPLSPALEWYQSGLCAAVPSALSSNALLRLRLQLNSPQRPRQHLRHLIFPSRGSKRRRILLLSYLPLCSAAASAGTRCGRRVLAPGPELFPLALSNP